MNNDALAQAFLNLGQITGGLEGLGQRDLALKLFTATQTIAQEIQGVSNPKEPFLFVHRVLTEEVIEIKSALDSLLEVLRHFIDMTADITTAEEGDYTDIKIVMHIKGVK